MDKRKKLISIITPCYNEEENVKDLYLRVKDIMKKSDKYEYEHIFIDNASQDKTVEILKGLAEKDRNLKIIVNIKNFGHFCSPHHAILQAKGDAVITLAADLQDPPEMINDFLKYWEEGHMIVIGVKPTSKENPIMFMLRKLYYKTIKRISETEHIANFTGFGLYDRSFVDVIKNLKEPYPYFRGLVAQYGVNRKEIEYVQPKREKGKSHNNFYTLYDAGMLGFVNHSKVPLRLASFIGFAVATLSLLIALGYLIYKIVFWSTFQVGVAPLVIGLFFFSSIQLFFIGILGEYIGAIYTQVKDRPLVIEKERINFDQEN
ncbi:MAG: glycosyltransferase family 2 protein [Patescibacteria group bacterium]